MISQFIDTERQIFTMVIPVLTRRPEKICCIVKDWKKPNTVYADRCLKINRKGSFYIRMPQSPERAKVLIFNEREKKERQNCNNTFKVVDIEGIPLKQKLAKANIANPLVYNFVIFAQNFCDRCGILDPMNSVYMSDNGKFRIDYLPVIKDRKTGREMSTPSRISRSRGVIEVSKKYFDKYTIPMRMAILLHEFSHYYLNKNMSNETEADLNALLIYLGLGYSRVEGAKVFLKVFKNSLSEGNGKRYEVIKNMLKNFEKNKYAFNNNYYYREEV